jgi:hypothetical protein
VRNCGHITAADTPAAPPSPPPPPPPPASVQESAMDTARLTLKKTLRRLDRVAKKSRSNHMVYVFLFAIALFMVVYAWSKVYRLLKWVF